MQTRWSERFAQRTRGMRISAVRELLKLTEQPDVISFGGGLPAPEVLSLEKFRESAERGVPRRGERAVQGRPDEGVWPRR